MHRVKHIHSFIHDERLFNCDSKFLLAKYFLFYLEGFVFFQTLIAMINPFYLIEYVSSFVFIYAKRGSKMFASCF